MFRSKAGVRAHGSDSSLGGSSSAGPGLKATDGGAPVLLRQVLLWQDVNGVLCLHRPQVLTSAFRNNLKNILNMHLVKS